MTTPRKRRRAGAPLNHEPAAVTYAREKAGLTQAQLADLCGWSFQLQCDMEAGRRNAGREAHQDRGEHQLPQGVHGAQARGERMSPSPPRDPGWTCDSCGAWNQSFRRTCRNCGLAALTEMTPFEFPATGQRVRVVDIDGEPWLVLADACAGLGLTNASMAAQRLDSDDLSTAEVIDSMGRRQKATIVNESGLYGLIFQSRKPEAKAFRRWITHEVLPTIRRTGSYGTPQFEIPRTLPEALRAYAAEVEAHDVTRAALAEAAPAADAWQVLASADPDWSVREAAYILNRDPGIDTGQNRLFNELRRMRVIDSRDIPYADHARHVKLRARSFTNRATGEETPAKPQVRITAAGLAYMHQKLGGTAPLQLDEPLPTGGA